MKAKSTSSTSSASPKVNTVAIKPQIHDRDRRRDKCGIKVIGSDRNN